MQDQKQLRHIHLFQCPQRFEAFMDGDAVEKQSYFIREPMEFDDTTGQEQEHYINEVFKDRRQKLFSVFTIENFDILYSITSALPKTRRNDQENGIITRAARGLLAQNLAATLSVIQNAIIRENAKRSQFLRENKDRMDTIPSNSHENFYRVASLLRGITNMCVTLLARVVTAPVSHYNEPDTLENNNNNNNNDRHHHHHHNNPQQQKKKRQKKALRDVDSDQVGDGIDIESLELALRGFVEMMNVETNHIWAAHPVPIRDFVDDDDDDEDDEMNPNNFDANGNHKEPNYKNRQELGRPKNPDGMPDPQTVLLGVQVVTHLIGQKRTYIADPENTNKALGKAVIDATKLLARCVAIRYEKSSAARAALDAQNNNRNNNHKQSRGSIGSGPTPSDLSAFDIGLNRGNNNNNNVLIKKDESLILVDEDNDAGILASQKQETQKNTASSAPAADPKIVLVAPILDIMLRLPSGAVSEEFSKLLVALLLELDVLSIHTAKEDKNNALPAETFAELLYLNSLAAPQQQNNNNNNMMMPNSGDDQMSSPPRSQHQQQNSGNKNQKQSIFANFSAVSADGTVSEPLVLAKLVSYFLETIVKTGVDAEPSSRDSKNTATFIDTLATTSGSLPLVAKHAPMLMVMIQSESNDSRKSCVTLIAELVAERYNSPSHTSWAVAIEQVASSLEAKMKGEQNNNNNNSAIPGQDAAATGPRAGVAAGMLVAHMLPPELVHLRDGYLADLLHRARDINHFVRLHTVKCWEVLVRRKAVPRCFHFAVFSLAVSRLADRNHLVHCASLGLLRSCLHSGWFSEQISHTYLANRRDQEYQILLKKIELEVKILFANDTQSQRNREVQDETKLRQLAKKKLGRMLKSMKYYMLDDSSGRTEGALRNKSETLNTNKLVLATLMGADPDADDDNDENDSDLALLDELYQQYYQQQNGIIDGSSKVKQEDGGQHQQQQQRNLPIGIPNAHDVFLSRIVFLGAAVDAAATAELGLRLAVDMLASKTTKDMVDAMQFIVSASAARMDSAQAACEKLLLLIFHHDPTIVNAVCDAFIAVYYTAFEASQVDPQARHLARAQKIVAMLLDSSEGTFAAVEKIVDVLADKLKTQNQNNALAASTNAAAVALARARGAFPTARAAAASASQQHFFSRDFFDANWGMVDGTLDPNISVQKRRTALRLYGCLARCEPREIQSRRAEIVRLIQAFPKDNLLVAHAFHVLARETHSATSQIDNLSSEFDVMKIALDDATLIQQQQRQSGSNNNNTNSNIASNPLVSLLRAIKLATLHLARPTEHCQGWISLAEAAISFLATALTAPSYLFAQIIESVREGVVALEDLGEKTAASVASAPNTVSPHERENIQIKILNRRAQFLFLLGHTCVKHLVTIEEYEKRELAAVSERGNVLGGKNSGGDENGATTMMMMPTQGRGSTGGRDSTNTVATTSGEGRKSGNMSAAGKKKNEEDNMSKELGLTSSDFQRNKVRDACDRARELTCLSDNHPQYKKICEGVPQNLLVPPIWGKYAPLAINQNAVKFASTAGIATPAHLSASLSADGANTNNIAAIAAAATGNAQFNYHPRLYRAMVTHRSTATLCLIKLMIASAAFCQKELPLLFTLLQQSDEPWEVKTGVVIGLGDLACVHPNMLQPYMKIASSGFYALLADADVRVRSVAIQICTHLVLNDMLIVGDHVHTIVRLAADADPTIRHSAEAFAAYLAVKRQKELHNIIPPLVRALSVTEEIGATYAITAAGVANDLHHNENDDDEDDADQDDAETSTRPSGKKSNNNNNKLKPNGKKDGAKKNQPEQQQQQPPQQPLRRLPPMSEEAFQQAISTLLENVEKGNATDSLITKLCQRFTRYTDTDLETMQLNRNLAFCLSELPFTSEREVKRITSDQLFEKYKDWMRDEKVNSFFDKIATKARRNISAGRGIGAVTVGAGGADGGAASPVPGGNHHQDAAGAAQATERRDRALLEEWISKLQNAAAGGQLSKPKKVDQDAGVGQEEDDQINTQNNGNNNMMMMMMGRGGDDGDAAQPTPNNRGSKNAKSQGKNIKQENNNKKKNNKLVDDSTSDDDGSDSSSESSSDDSSDDNNNNRRNKKNNNKNAKKPSPKAKKAGGKQIKQEASSSSSSSSSSSDESSQSESSSEEEERSTRRKPTAKRASGGGRR